MSYHKNMLWPTLKTASHNLNLVGHQCFGLPFLLVHKSHQLLTTNGKTYVFSWAASLYQCLRLISVQGIAKDALAISKLCALSVLLFRVLKIFWPSLFPQCLPKPTANTRPVNMQATLPHMNTILGQISTFEANKWQEVAFIVRDSSLF
jgi:hypothetical protein